MKLFSSPLLPLPPTQTWDGGFLYGPSRSVPLISVGFWRQVETWTVLASCHHGPGKCGVDRLLTRCQSRETFTQRRCQHCSWANASSNHVPHVFCIRQCGGSRLTSILKQSVNRNPYTGSLFVQQTAVHDKTCFRSRTRAISNMFSLCAIERFSFNFSDPKTLVVFPQFFHYPPPTSGPATANQYEKADLIDI